MDGDAEAEVRVSRGRECDVSRRTDPSLTDRELLERREVSTVTWGVVSVTRPDE